MNEEFNLYTKNFYELDENLYSTIKGKTEELINEIISVSEKFYKIGAFVNSHITYDLSYLGKKITAIEIFNGKRGVCEHYTILYNAMLNAIGIKTIKIFGWSFDEDRTSADEKTVGHAWTGAFNQEIGKIVELDATWNLFEGIPSGHILKGFNKESVYHPTGYEYFKTHKIQLVENLGWPDEPIVYKSRIELGPIDSKTSIIINNGEKEEGKGNEDGKDKEREDKVEKDKDEEKTD